MCNQEDRCDVANNKRIYSGTISIEIQNSPHNLKRGELNLEKGTPRVCRVSNLVCHLVNEKWIISTPSAAQLHDHPLPGGAAAAVLHPEEHKH